MIELHYLTEKGRKLFIEYIRKIKNDLSEQLPLNEFNYEPNSIKLSPIVQIDENFNFSTRYELGGYLYVIFKDISRNELLNNLGIWDWLTVLWFDKICPQNQGHRNVRETARYIVSKDRTDYYRHLILCAWELYSLHEKYSRLFLRCSPYIHNDWTEQLASRQDIITNKRLIEAVDRLYWDNNRERPKTSASDRNRLGNVRRLVSIIAQLDLTYDLYAMSAEDILLLLPKEFDEWKN